MLADSMTVWHASCFAADRKDKQRVISTELLAAPCLPWMTAPSVSAEQENLNLTPLTSDTLLMNSKKSKVLGIVAIQVRKKQCSQERKDSQIK